MKNNFRWQYLKTYQIAQNFFDAFFTVRLGKIRVLEFSTSELSGDWVSFRKWKLFLLLFLFSSSHSISLMIETAGPVPSTPTLRKLDDVTKKRKKWWKLKKTYQVNEISESKI